MSATVIFLVVLCACNLHEAVCKVLEVKWAEGNNRKPDRGLTEKNYYLEHKDPEGTLYGPEALFFLDGMCFDTSVDRYLYRICPFQNVTMRRITASRATLLGYWKEWTGGYSSQGFSGGQACGAKSRTASLAIACVAPTTPEILSPLEMGVPADSVVEEDTCHHSFILQLPLACRLLKEDIVPEEEEEEEAHTPRPEKLSQSASLASPEDDITGADIDTDATVTAATGGGGVESDTSTDAGEHQGKVLQPVAPSADQTDGTGTGASGALSGDSDRDSRGKDPISAARDDVTSGDSSVLLELKKKIDELQQTMAALLASPPSSSSSLSSISTSTS